MKVLRKSLASAFVQGLELSAEAVLWLCLISIITEGRRQ